MIAERRGIIRMGHAHRGDAEFLGGGNELLEALLDGWVRETENRDEYLKKYPGFDPRFLFVNLGYNLRATELQGAIGSVQLPKLAGFVNTRRENTAAWKKDLAKFGEFLAFQKETPSSQYSPASR